MIQSNLGILMIHRYLLLLLALQLGARGAAPDIEKGRTHWAFQPVTKPTPPFVKEGGWVRNDIDRFILARLEAAGLKPSAEADRATLIRRVTLNLIGLPPSPEEVTAFVADASPQAWERLIDRLLESPHYGERWGRHWLDLARYADSSGFHNDLDRPFAWKYRDYVIHSFNEDKPYARFVAEQLAGDEIDGADESSLIGTGFCRNGPSNDDNMGKSPEAIAQYRVDQLDDVVATTGSVFLGLTIGCARCHDHKTEPILAKDYYSLMAVFNGTERLGMPKGARDEVDKHIADKHTVMALIETKAAVPVTHVLLRGLAASHSDEVGPAVPVVLTSRSVTFPQPTGQTSLRRRTLAEWIVSPSNPLTWRVLANRVWQHHFGAGIVASPSNFGFSGAAPTHPELLDFLASELIKNGGHLKPLHKIILMSATYRQQSGGNAFAHDKDPGNTLLWRQSKQQMEAEVIRDSILCVSGKLNTKRGGPGFKPRIRPDLLDASQRNKWPTIEHEGAAQWRRSVYIYVKRQLLMPNMELFDAPTTIESCALRMHSTVPTQALVLMNDEFTEEQAGFLAQRAMAESGNDEGLAIQRLFFLTLAHAPSVSQLRQAAAFVEQRAAVGNRIQALGDLSHVLLNSSEFVYID